MSDSESRTLAALLSVLDRCAGRQVWVIGDLMVDEYISGSVERISPEAPVPVVRVRATEDRLGGAANVARQAAVLGAQVSLGGVVGMDAAGDSLLELCRAAGIDSRAVIRRSDRRTTRKLRVIGHSQQLVRLDWEDSHPCSEATSEEILSRIGSEQAPDVIVLSDYAKGVIAPEILARLRRMALPKHCSILVDPKHKDFSRYRGATTITPNLRELELASSQTFDPGDFKAIAAAARKLADAAAIEEMVVTLSDRGMMVVPVNGPETLIPAIQREVYDVTGAGDTAIAVMAVALAAQGSLVAAVTIANAAAGLSIEHIGAVAIDAASIRHALSDLPVSKVIASENLAARSAAWRAAGKRIVFTNGCFDILHAGHLSLLNEAAKLGDVLIVAINSDASVKRLKGAERPLMPQAERAELLAALSCVDAVTIFDEDTPLAAVRQVNPHVLVKGQDYENKEVVGRDFVEAAGGRVALVPLVPAKSTSALVERIRIAQGNGK